jgi:hypothetical protein
MLAVWEVQLFSEVGLGLLKNGGPTEKASMGRWENYLFLHS